MLALSDILRELAAGADLAALALALDARDGLAALEALPWDEVLDGLVAEVGAETAGAIIEDSQAGFLALFQAAASRQTRPVSAANLASLVGPNGPQGRALGRYLRDLSGTNVTDRRLRQLLQQRHARAMNARLAALEQAASEHDAEFEVAAQAKPYLRIDRAAEAAEPGIRSALRAALDEARTAIDRRALASALAAGDLDGAVAAVPLRSLAGAALEVAPLILAAAVAGGVAGVRDLRRRLGLEATFDQDASLEGWVASAADALAERMTGDADALVRSVAGSELRDGLLVPAAAAAVIQDRLGLGAGASRAVAKAVGELPPELPERERLASARELALTARAEGLTTLSGDTAYAAANEGQRQAWTQARDAGLLPRHARRYWGTQRDDRVCPSCRRLEGQSVGLDEPWITYRTDSDGDGIAESGQRVEVMNPGETHEFCRCWALVVAVET